MSLEIKGKTLDRATFIGLPKLRVEVWPLGINQSEPLAVVSTNENGEFATTLDDQILDSLNAQSLFLRVRNDNRLLVSTEETLRLIPGEPWTDLIVLIDPVTPQATARPVPPPTVEVPRIPDLPKISELGFKLPRQLKTFLENEKITTVGDILARGGIANLKELPVLKDKSVLNKLEAHARLSTLNLTPDLQTKLIDAGFTSLGEIARTPRSKFLADTELALTPEEAEKVYHRADIQSKLLSHLATDSVRTRINIPDEVEEEAPCECQDCQSAISPGAYLIDLLGYVNAHLVYYWPGFAMPQPVNLQYMNQLLYQQFDKLPMSCGAIEKTEHQVRLAIEVLRRYLLNQPDISPSPLYNPYPLKSVFAGDVDGDGRDEIIALPDWSSSVLTSNAEFNALYVLDYDPNTRVWNHLSPIAGHPYGADVVPSQRNLTIKAGFAADVDGDDRDEIILVVEQARRSIFWVMDYDPTSKRWSHLSPISNDPDEADIICSTANAEIAFACAANVADDTRAQIVANIKAPAGQTRLFWIMDYEPTTRRWSHLTPIVNHPLNADLDPASDDPTSTTTAAFIVPGDYDGDSRQELIIAMDDPTTPLRRRYFWALDYDPANGWNHLRSGFGGDGGSASGLAEPIPLRFGVAADIDDDGRDEFIAGVTDLRVGGDPNVLQVFDYESFGGRFVNWDWAMAQPLNCTAANIHAGAAMAVNSEGDNIPEIAVVPIFERGANNPRSGLWVMSRQNGNWVHQSPIPNHPFNADLDWTLDNPVNAQVIKADVDGDGSEELLVYPTMNQGIWVMKYNFANVLWEHLTFTDLTAAEKNYRLESYRMLLMRLGTSFEEIRLARTGTAEERKALADRLGIVETFGPNSSSALEALYLDPATTLTESAIENLFGLVDTTRDPYQPGPEAQVLQWRLAYQQNVWLEQDFPAHRYDARHPQRLPIIDPDVIGPDDFRSPIQKVNANDPDQPFDLWIRRREWVDQQMTALLNGASTAGMISVMKRPKVYPDPQTPQSVRITPWSNAVTLAYAKNKVSALSNGTPQDIRQQVTRLWNDTHLTPEALRQFVTLADKEQSGQHLTDSEKEECASICMQALKSYFFTAWNQEEERLQTAMGKALLSPRYFQEAVTEPTEGAWGLRLPRPIIDPELIKRTELPESKFRLTGRQRSAQDLWDRRKSELDTIATTLRAIPRDNNSWESLITEALGNPPQGQSWADRLSEIRNQLDDPNTSQQAQQAIKSLWLTVNGFTQLTNLQTRLRQNRTTSQSEWNSVYAILTTAKKLRTLYRTWSTQERSQEYWQLLKARLPRWRAPQEIRQGWKQALATNSQPPIIDPDVINLSYFSAADNDGKPEDIWRTRTQAITTERSALVGLVNLERMYARVDGLGLSLVEFRALVADSEQGRPVSSRLRQLGLTNQGFSYLARIDKLVQGNQRIESYEWEEIADILTAVWKSRQYADWRAEEYANNISLSPYRFEAPKLDPLVFPPPPPRELPRWRAARRNLREWEDTLQARNEQREQLRQAMRNLVSEVEEATLPGLRDALVMASRAPGGSLEEKAKWLTKRLLMDFRAGGCQRTTRVAQALETIQSLLWAARTGQLDLQLRLDAPHFDEEWLWIGSYSTWRAVMFVYLYPENLLIPTLKRQQTPLFRSLVRELRSDRQFTPAKAQNIFANYSDYLSDIVDLNPAACMTADGINQDRIAGRYAFMFGHGNHSHKIYWSTLKIASSSDYSQSYWIPLEGIEKYIASIIGADVYEPSATQRFLYLFVQTEELGKQNLSYRRYNLETGSWDGGDLSLPSGATSFLSARLRVKPGTQSPPILAIETVKDVVYSRQLDTKGTNWEQAGFQPLLTSGEWRHLQNDMPNSYGYDIFQPSGTIPALSPNFYVAGDINGDGRDEIIGGLEPDGQGGFFAWVLNYENPLWKNLPVIRLDSVNRPEGIKAYIGDFDGDNIKEVLFIESYLDNAVPFNTWWLFKYHNGSWITLGRGGSISNDEYEGKFFSLAGRFQGLSRDEIVLLKYEPTRAPGGAHWRKHSNFDVISFFRDDQDGKWYPRVVGNIDLLKGRDIQFICKGDFDKDGKDELVIAPSPTNPSEGNDFWVFDFRNGKWEFMGSPQNQIDAVIDFSAGGEQVLFVLSADIDGDGFDELLASVSGTNKFWIAKFQPNIFLSPGTDPSEKGSWSTNAILELDPGTIDEVGATSYAVAGDFDGDGRDEIAIIPWIQGDSRANNIYIADYEPRTKSWQRMQPLDLDPTNSTGIAFSVAGRFTGRLSAIRQNIDDLAVIPGDRRPSMDFGSPVKEGLWARGFFPITDPTLPKCSYSNVAPTRIQIQPSASSKILTKALNEAGYLANRFPRRSNLTYIEEYCYSLPLVIALQLQRAGEYRGALDWFRVIYDYAAPLKERKIYYGLLEEEGNPSDYINRAADWLLDPLNPHAIATTRKNAYTRYTLMALIRCLLEYADAEFTRDTGESVARARILYQTALDLLETPELKQDESRCHATIRLIRETLESSWPTLAPAARSEFISGLTPTRPSTLGVVAKKMEELSAQKVAANEVIPQLRAVIANTEPLQVLTASRLLEEAQKGLTRTQSTAMARIGPLSSNEITTLLDSVETRVFSDRFGASLSWIPTMAFRFCTVPNPILNGLRLRTELNLYKIQTCRNIAGLKRELDLYAAPTDSQSGLPQIGSNGQLILPGTVMLRPTPYRYLTLVDRAKQLCGIAQQIENSFLSSLQQRDLEAFNLMKARQDIQRARANVQLQDLKIKEAESNVTLANLQKRRSEIQAETYEEWLNEGLLDVEQLLLSQYWALAAVQSVAAAAKTTASILDLALRDSMIPLTTGQKVAIGIALGAEGVATIAGYLLQANISVTGFYASYERRRQEWQLQKRLADQDVIISDQQIQIAQDRVRIAGQEGVIAQTETENAEATLDFLNNKFTNVELYEWMSGVLEGVYRYFLQEATSMAQLAVKQLAFERQETPPRFIQADYWQPPKDDTSTSDATTAGPDRRGLTGSARLLQDIYQLDQYAFDNNNRKLQLSKTISLARLAPVEFQRFLETGVLSFDTPMSLFNRDFPGHYLRLIHKVRTTVVALIPPAQGIRATLTNGGVSRVVIGGDIFQTVIVRREPQSIALSAATNATGLFDLDPQNDMLVPFEGFGVDTRWELRLPKAANPFDFNGIADVLFTLEYTALDDFTYRQQVIQELDTRFRGDIPFNLRNQFADQWYDLCNAELLLEAEQMRVRFTTTRADFPPNVSELKITQIALYVARSEDDQDELPVTLRFREGTSRSNASIGGEAETIEGLISTRTGQAGSWGAILTKSPIGEWELAVPNTEIVRNRFKNGKILDILLVVSLSGELPVFLA